MTGVDELLAQVEHDLRGSRQPSLATCRACDLLPHELRTALAPALSFLGFVNARSDTPTASASAPLPRHLRMTVARLMLLRVAVETGNPQWSTGVLEDILAITAALPGGDVGDALDALSTLLVEAPLTQQLSDFLTEAVELWRHRYRTDHARYDFALLTSRLVRSGAPALACLAALCLPPALLYEHRAHILSALPRGPHRYLAASLIESRGPAATNG